MEAEQAIGGAEVYMAKPHGDDSTTMPPRNSTADFIINRGRAPEHKDHPPLRDRTAVRAGWCARTRTGANLSRKPRLGLRSSLVATQWSAKMRNDRHRLLRPPGQSIMIKDCKVVRIPRLVLPVPLPALGT